MTKNSRQQRTEENLSESRKEVLSRIRQYEKEGGESFFLDVESDPPSKTLMPEDVDYLNRTPKDRICCIAARILSGFYEEKTKKQFRIRIVGAENLKDIKTGAVFTSNHFSPFENMAVKAAAEKAPGRHRFYKVVREGNFFMPGVIGFLLKYCDTLPVSSNLHTMERFNRAVAQVLENGDFLLVYPEQAMWWNYRKPRPYRIGAFYFAAKSKVPLVPCFVTMENGDTVDSDGALQQYYTVHIMPTVYPDNSVPARVSAKMMMDRNAELARAKYEEIYGVPLTYDS